MDTLSSSRTDDEISYEVAELVGLDHIELVKDLLVSRQSAAKDVSASAFVLLYMHIESFTALSLLGLNKRTRRKWHHLSVVK